MSVLRQSGIFNQFYLDGSVHVNDGLFQRTTFLKTRYIVN